MKYSLTLAAILSSLVSDVDAFSVFSNQLSNRNYVLSEKFTEVGRSSLVKTFMSTQETEGTKEIKVGVIGCGRIGIVHLGAITKAPNVTPIIVSNPTISKAEQGRYSGVCVCVCSFICLFTTIRLMCS